jgi:flagellar biosynthesis protein
MHEGKKRKTAAAVAYTPRADTVPKVVARGHGDVAERIIALAAENGIPVRADENLAALLAALDVDMDIPPELYRAVAEVMVFVYRLNGMMVPTGRLDSGGGGQVRDD